MVEKINATKAKIEKILPILNRNPGVGDIFLIIKNCTIKVATPFFKPQNNKTDKIPDYYLHETDKWLVFPHELQGLSMDEIKANKPDPSYYGVIVASISILIEGPLGYKKLILGRKMNNPVIIAEAKETLFCLNLSILVILGVGLNFLFSLWYFDPIAALLMIPWLYKEYKEHR